MRRYRLCVDDRLYESSSPDDLIGDLDPEHIDSLFTIWIRKVLSEYGLKGVAERVCQHAISAYNIAPDLMDAYEAMQWGAVYGFITESFDLSCKRGRKVAWLEGDRVFSFEMMEVEE